MTVQLPLDDFQLQVNFQRAQHAQAAPDRLLRVGDVFLVRGMPGEVLPTDAEIWDISAAARDVAKAAYYGAGAATVDEDYIEKMGAVAPEPMAEAPSGTFDIRQQAMPPAGPERRCDHDRASPDPGRKARRQKTSSRPSTRTTSSTSSATSAMAIANSCCSRWTQRAGAEILVVDVATTKKVPALIDSLQAAGLVAAPSPGPGGDPDGSVALVVATHPHADHIGGMQDFLTKAKPRIAEFWDPGYYHTTQDYLDMMAAIEANSRIIYAQPTAGYKRWFGSALVTVLSPSVGLRNKFDTYGTEVNDSSLSLRIEFPAARAVKRDAGRNLVDKKATMALILGADAQTLSWSHVLTDFPQLGPNSSDANKAIRAATGTDLLSAKGAEGLAPRLEARCEPGAGGAHFAEPDTGFEQGRQRIRVPAFGRPGTYPRGPRSHSVIRRRAQIGRRPRHLLHLRHRGRRRRPWFDRGRHGRGKSERLAFRRQDLAEH